MSGTSAQVQRICNHSRRAQAHCQRGDHRRQQPARERKEQPGGERHTQGVVDESEAQVLPHVGHRGHRQRPRGRDATQIALDQGQLRAVHGHVGARTHRDADIGTRQRRRIVDTVTGHRDDAALRLQLLDQLQLVGGFDFAVHFFDAQALPHSAGRGQTVAGGHHDAQACLAQ